MSTRISLRNALNGVFPVYKPKGWTSRKATDFVQFTLSKELYQQQTGHTFEKKSLQQKDRLKIGHGGTLDPMARGILVLGVGTGCKELHNYLDGAKEYTVTAKFGEATDTYDAEGTVTLTGPTHHLTRKGLEEALVHFRGDIIQIPPIYSALKVNGKRMYEYARKGLALPIPIQPRNVKIAKLELGEFDGTTCILHVACGGGTYMRSLVHDIAQSLGTCAHMTELERTRQGPYTLDTALTLDHSFCLKDVLGCIHSSC